MHVHTYIHTYIQAEVTQTTIMSMYPPITEKREYLGNESQKEKRCKRIHELENEDLLDQAIFELRANKYIHTYVYAETIMGNQNLLWGRDSNRRVRPVVLNQNKKLCP